VFAEVARVLTPTGSLWLNLGDCYSRHQRYGAPAKALLLAPERLLLALTADGWRCRNKVTWAKTNAVPHPVRDRLTATHEVLYLLVRARFYYFDLDAIREPHRTTIAPRRKPPTAHPEPWRGPLSRPLSGLDQLHAAGIVGHPRGKNPGDVWRLAAVGLRGSDHHATFPPALVERPLLATCPRRVCTACTAPWREDLPTCACAAPPRKGVALDPFFGSGTVGVVAARHGRDWVGIELNGSYARSAARRLGITEEGAHAACAA
jgi:DNA modification methylase